MIAKLPCIIVVPPLSPHFEYTMTIRPIIQYPAPLLRETAVAITIFDASLHELADDLLETMRAAPGIGITACHIGILKRIYVLELSAEDGVQVYVNPEIVWLDDNKVRHQEGSVSMPGMSDEVERHAKIRIRYQDINGAQHEEEAEGLRAICHQHEIDQLNGIFWIQRLSRLKRDRLIKRYEKSKR